MAELDLRGTRLRRRLLCPQPTGVGALRLRSYRKKYPTSRCLRICFKEMDGFLLGELLLFLPRLCFLGRAR